MWSGAKNLPALLIFNGPLLFFLITPLQVLNKGVDNVQNTIVLCIESYSIQKEMGHRRRGDALFAISHIGLNKTSEVLWGRNTQKTGKDSAIQW